MANYIGTLLLALACATLALAYPNRYRDRGYYYPVPDSTESEEYYQLIPVHRDQRSIPANENAIVVPRRQIMMAASAPQRIEQERPVFMEREPERERDYLYAAPTNYEPVPAETGSNGHYDYVDYGAYTGGHGAFGWYSDHPVYVQSGGHYE